MTKVAKTETRWNEETTNAVVTAYKAGLAKGQNNKEIVSAIATAHGMSEAMIRGKLITEKEYVTGEPAPKSAGTKVHKVTVVKEIEDGLGLKGALATLDKANFADLVALRDAVNSLVNEVADLTGDAVEPESDE